MGRDHPDDDEAELADLESAVLDGLEAVDDDAPDGTSPLEAARRRRAERQVSRLVGPIGPDRSA